MSKNRGSVLITLGFKQRGFCSLSLQANRNQTPFSLSLSPEVRHVVAARASGAAGDILRRGGGSEVYVVVSNHQNPVGAHRESPRASRSPRRWRPQVACRHRYNNLSSSRQISQKVFLFCFDFDFKSSDFLFFIFSKF